MSADFRIQANFFSHPKTLKLRRRVGDSGLLGLMQLWAFAAESRPSGALYGMDEESVELISNWEGEPGAFCALLIELKFIDKGEDGSLSLHDWEEHNPWVVGTEERKAKARKAAGARWGKSDKCSEHATSINEHCSEHATSMQQASFSNAKPMPPVPVPDIRIINTPPLSPTDPNANISATDVAGVCVAQEPVKSEYSQDFEDFWKAYPRKKAKDSAWKAWKKLGKSRPALSHLHDAIERAKKSADWQRDGGQFVPYPASWLNQRRWDDEFVPVETGDPSMKYLDAL